MMARLEVLPINMQRKAFLIILFFLAAMISVPVSGQQPAENAEQKPAEAKPKVSPCPKLAVKSATPQLIREGTPVMFAADIVGGDPEVTPNIIWNVSSGMIKAGQSGRHIEVDSTGAGAARELRAELWVGGYAPECGTTASVSVRVVPPAMLVDEFGELDPDKEGERLARAAAGLAEPKDKLFVMVYAGRTSVRGYTYTALKRIIDTFAKIEMPADRVRPVDGGFREQPAIEIWHVPEGAEQPRPTPTVDRREIVYPKPTPRKKPTPRRGSN